MVSYGSRTNPKKRSKTHSRMRPHLPAGFWSTWEQRNSSTRPLEERKSRVAPPIPFQLNPVLQVRLLLPVLLLWCFAPLLLCARGGRASFDSARGCPALLVCVLSLTQRRRPIPPLNNNWPHTAHTGSVIASASVSSALFYQVTSCHTRTTDTISSCIGE